MEERYYLMGCGHVANAEHNGKPVCVICFGIHPGATEIVDEAPSLEGRTAYCTYCDKEVPSDYSLPFFEYRPNKEYDKYYCGCRGWD